MYVNKFFSNAVQVFAVALIAVVNFAPSANAQPVYQVLPSVQDETHWALEPSTQTDFLTDLLTADVIIIGERHGRKAHQDIEARLIHAIALAGKSPSVVLEMLKPEQMNTIEAHRASNPLRAMGLGVALEWWDTGWPAWSYYQPVFQAAYDADLPLFAADLDNQTAKFIEASASGLAPTTSLPTDIPTLVPEFGLEPALAASVNSSWASAMKAAHCDLIDDKRLNDVTNLQIARDQSMALAAIQALQHNPDQPAVLIVGSSHARLDRSIGLYIQSALPQLKVLSVALREVGDIAMPENDVLVPSISSESPPFHYVWQTDKVESEDQCARVRQLFGNS